MNEVRVDPEDWEANLAAADGPQLVVGGPGTGKTEFLARRAALLVHRGVEPESIAVFSFSRRGAADLRDRIHTATGGSGGIVAASTYHSFALRLLEAHGGELLGGHRLPALLTGPEQVALVGELLTVEDPAGWSPAHRGLLGSRTFAREVTDFVLRCREQMIAPADVQRRVDQGMDQWRGLPGFLERYAAALGGKGRIDYGSLITAALDVLEQPGATASVGAQYRYVIVDEYQDTTPAQAELLRRLSAGPRHLTVAADPYQSIYSFRGADLHNVARFPEEFRAADGAPGRRLVLTTSFRVPRAVLDAAERVTESGLLPGAAGPVRSSVGGGSVEVYSFQQHTEEAEWVAGEIERLHVGEDRLPYSRIGVFVRSKRRFLRELSRALERRGIPHDRPDSRLADHPAVRVVFDCVIAATETGPERARAARRLLLGPLFSLPLGAWRRIERDRLRTGASWPDVIRHRVPDGGPLAELLAEPAWASDRSAAAGFWLLWTSLPQFRPVAIHPERREDRAAWTSLSQVLARLEERDPDVTLTDYVRMAEAEDFEARPLLAFRAAGDDRLTVTTLHQAKGLEFDVVFLADAVSGVFPDLRPRESLLGTRHLAAATSGDAAAYLRFRLQEEMRLAYTAMTRARHRVVWTATVAGPDEGPGGPSRFLALAAGTDAATVASSRPGSDLQPITAPQYEAHLRRLLRDAERPAPDRLAAAAVLATSGRLRPPEEYAGFAAPGPDDGLVGAGHTLSASQAGRYDDCPRRYALEYRLGIGDDVSVYMAFGTLIHSVLETVEQDAMARSQPHGTAAAARRALDDRFDPADFGGEPWASAWRTRALEALDRLYEMWPSPGRPVALEHPFAIELGGAVWRGRIDRIEERRGHVAIVDYKTTRNPAPVDQTKASLQLGLYLLAASLEPELTAIGPPGAAEFWFPLSPRTGGVSTRAFDPGELPGVTDRLVAAAAGIRAEAWPPAPGPGCERCRVRSLCPAWPEGREAFT